MTDFLDNHDKDLLIRALYFAIIGFNALKP